MKNTSLILLFLVVSAFLNVSLNPVNNQGSDQAIIEKIIEELKSRDDSSNEKIYPPLHHIYVETEFRPVWNRALKKQAIDILSESTLHGFNSDDYLLEDIRKLLSLNPEGSTETNLRLDVYLSYGMLVFAKHMTRGRINPGQFSEHWQHQPFLSEEEIANLLTAGVKKRTLNNFVKRITPAAEYYNALLAWMKAYHSGRFKDNGQIHFTQMPVKKGAEGEEIIELKYRLIQYGNLSDRDVTPVFDGALENAVKEFQEFMGLKPDGIVGRKTLNALNITLEEKESIVRVNMERTRWLMQNLPNKLLLVNIAGYEAYAFENRQNVFQTAVIVGKVQHETPIFSSQMEYIEFNPSWVVPRSISVNEILPIIKKNRGYLSSQDFEVLLKGEVINKDSIDWSRYSADNFPFVLRQKPGPFNSLGRIKFVFPNSYAVFLHDTPAKYLFEEEETRAFSHGCVRVKDPEKLAAWILEKQGITRHEIDSILTTKETYAIQLEEQLPVYLTYWTVFPDFPSRGLDKLHWVRDIYGRDKAILNALDATYH